jgi:hypothetical protein
MDRPRPITSLVGVASCTITAQGEQLCGGATRAQQSPVSTQRSLQAQQLWGGGDGRGAGPPPAQAPWNSSVLQCGPAPVRPR